MCAFAILTRRNGVGVDTRCKPGPDRADATLLPNPSINQLPAAYRKMQPGFLLYFITETPPSGNDLNDDLASVFLSCYGKWYGKSPNVYSWGTLPASLPFRPSFDDL